MTDVLPRTADEFEAFLNEEKNLEGFFQGGKPKPEFGEFMRNYAEAIARRDSGIGDQIKAEAQKAYGEMIRAGILNANMVRPDLTPARPFNKHHNPKAPGAKLDAQYGNWGDYLGAIWSGNVTQEGLQARADIKKIMNSFGSTVPSDGGFLIPESLRSELLRVALETAVVRSRARVVPMETLTVPYPTIDSVTNSGSVFGGVTGYWTEEGAKLTESAPKFGRVTLTAKKLTVYAEIPNELFQDSLISLQSFMDQSFPEALSFFEDVAFIRGSGVGEPQGFLNAAAAVSVAAETGQTAGTIVWENLAGMFARMIPSSLSRCVWIANIDTFKQLATMALSVGTGGSAVWIGAGAATDGSQTPPVTILGRPVIFTEKVNSVGNSGDINLVDLGYYLIGDRQMIQSETSTHYQFGNDKTAVRVIERVDGRPWIQNAITPNQGSNTLSPFVKLAAR
jgi:HK97 family phage major capsid protein